MIGAALILIVTAMALVRAGWSGRRRLAVAGWLLAGSGLTVLAWRDGAWGLAIGTVAGSAAALAMLLYAGWKSPAKPRRPAREAPTVALAHRWRGLGRRLAVFVLVVPIAFAAAQWFAFGVQALARRMSAGEADAIVLTLTVQPVLWASIMTLQMIRGGPLRMLVAPGVAALLGTILWGIS